MPKEYRIAVGDKDDLRSTVWKFQVQKSDIYIIGRMFGSTTKVSLHKSGDCQWSANEDWWKLNNPEMRNADRHMEKWSAPRPEGSEACHIFRVHIPRSELRKINIEENLKKVTWIEAPSENYAVSLECYITPPTLVAPEESSTFPHPHLVSMKLECGRWFVILKHINCPNKADIEVLRDCINEQCRENGWEEPKPGYRISAFAVSNNGARGIIELCPIREMA